MSESPEKKTEEATETTRPGEQPEAAKADTVGSDAGAAKPAPEDNTITIDDFFNVELRVAKVLSAEPVPKTDKLLRLEVDLGTETRQLVAGVALAYEPEALVGKKIIVVANLKPARIRGVESRGMLLAADAGGRPIVASFDEDVPPGTRVR